MSSLLKFAAFLKEQNYSLEDLEQFAGEIVNRYIAASSSATY